MAKSKHKIATVDITSKLGERLKAAREERGYTREQLSERSGVSVRYIIAIENEGNIPRVSVLNDLLHSLGLSADAIFYPEDTQDDTVLDQLTRLIRHCDERDRQTVLALVNSLLDSRASMI